MLKKHKIRMGGGSTVEFKSHRWMRFPYITKYLYLSIYLSIYLSFYLPTDRHVSDIYSYSLLTITHTGKVPMRFG